MLLFIKKKKEKESSMFQRGIKIQKNAFTQKKGKEKWRGVPSSLLFFVQRSVEYKISFYKRFQISGSSLSIHKLILKRLH